LVDILSNEWWWYWVGCHEEEEEMAIPRKLARERFIGKGLCKGGNTMCLFSLARPVMQVGNRGSDGSESGLLMAKSSQIERAV
jgi:hypothetical protein